MATQFRAYRQAMKLSQKDVADALGIGRAAYSHYESGRREPNIEMLLKLADFFHVTVDDLLGRKVPAARLGSSE